MWTTLALALALQPAAAPQPGAAGLNITNQRLTYGHLGAARKDNQFLPGDHVFLAFEVQGMKFDAAGKASCSIGMEVFDGAGQKIYRQMPRPQAARNFLGGNSLPFVVDLNVPLEQKSGDYTIKVTVEDTAAKASREVTQKVRVLPADFGLVQVNTSTDAEGRAPRVPVSVVGESLFVNFAVVGFGREPAKKQPNVEVSLRVLEENGKPTMANPVLGKINADIPADAKLVPLQFALALNRAGRFTVEVSATDRVSGKTARVSFPLKVMAAD